MSCQQGVFQGATYDCLYVVASGNVDFSESMLSKGLVTHTSNANAEMCCNYSSPMLTMESCIVFAALGELAQQIDLAAVADHCLTSHAAMQCCTRDLLLPEQSRKSDFRLRMTTRNGIPPWYFCGDPEQQ